MFDLLPSRCGRVLVCGHRGHIVDGHENTRPALNRAAELGASLCEIDLRQTKDGCLVVFHDDVLDNASTGKGLISQLAFEEIAQVRTRSRSEAEIEGQPIEAFEQVLTFARDLGLGLIVEIKDRVQRQEYLETIIRHLRDTGMLARTLISSFDYVVLNDIKRLDQEIRTMGINYHRLVAPADTARSAALDVMNTDYPQFTPDIAVDLHEAGTSVSHFLPRPEYFAVRRGYGSDYHQTLRTYLQDGLIDILVCDDVSWAVEFVTDCGLSIERPFAERALPSDPADKSEKA